MARLYTRTGDDGTTGVLGPGRVGKDDPRIEAVGAVDELNAALGVLLAVLKDRGMRKTLLGVQDDLFTLGADLAAPRPGGDPKLPRVTGAHVAALEAAMERLDVGRVTEFTPPRGPEALARLHWARAVARRAERRAVALARSARVNPEALRYLNRLSSLLFTMAVALQRRERRRAEHPSYR
ncbi:MAG: ATP:cob(I)alamin adenosyltransferase [Euryarchaeota archaeon RBG_19FT_COMBO_69_17]|nr:MAG: ATP:cob(I)alamin adenosyltransferase [Euryarchaeota archaeon RBG_19FT_COMBO_69_17]